MHVLVAVARLVLPVLLLLSVGMACLLYGDAAVEGLGSFAGKPMAAGLAALPLTFLVIHLTNRRYGSAYAFAQVIIAWPLALVLLPGIVPMISAAQDMRVASSFAGGLFFAQIVGIVVFDGLRGPGWWKAPLFASLISGVVFCLVAFPAAFAGTAAEWSKDMFGYMALTSGASVVMLIPYGLLRSLVPPLPGFGGY